jgi:hypothetical protein
MTLDGRMFYFTSAATIRQLCEILRESSHEREKGRKEERE